MRVNHRYKNEILVLGMPYCVECNSYHERLRKRTHQGNSFDNNLNYLRKYILALMIREGRDLTVCEVCGKPITGRMVIHHEKYEGATYYDLKIACQSCNTKPENQLLA